MQCSLDTHYPHVKLALATADPQPLALRKMCDPQRWRAPLWPGGASAPSLRQPAACSRCGGWAGAAGWDRAAPDAVRR